MYLPQSLKPVDATAGCVTTNGGVTSDYISVRNAQMIYIILQFTQAVGHATVIQPQKATAVAPTGNISITTAVEIWQNADTAASDTLVKATSATSLTLAADVKKKMVVIRVDPAALGDTYDVVGFTISDSSQATNFVSGMFLVVPKYQQAIPPTVITD